MITQNLDKLNFDEKGLIPAIVQEYSTGKVLMMAYMNRQSLDISLAEGKTCFYSRSREGLWRKGETSGNFQQIVSVKSDCDGDTLLIKVIKAGPACHTGNESCFFDDIFEDDRHIDFSMDDLYSLIMGRKTEKKEGSYTTYLFEKGKEKILKKVGEECSEVIIGAMKNSKEETVYELADLAYHSLVLMAEMGISLEDIREELAGRHVVDKKTKQETMK
ncbi:MAG: bifunctional phosphoribosyl-AMP cyclohydrolase/phosphoribosyl-ATP diphosphatase HisIE [Christensenellales bacterium]|jgi:phosphoribosyl-ATP pyrophosphohydrolase/phosphoribosyl-AMP cyclohydrolase